MSKEAMEFAKELKSCPFCGLEEFKDIIKKYNDCKEWIRDFVVENKDFFAATHSDVRDLDWDSNITNIKVNNDKFNITPLNEFKGSIYTINIELPLDCLTKEGIVYLALKQILEN